MKLVLVCGPFGSGTTAVAGMLAGLGLPGIEPYFVSNDERTPNTFESIAFRETLLRIVSEQTLSFNPRVDRVAEIKRSTIRSARAATKQPSSSTRSPHC
jgi:ABC-type antimicrobial peptide transport system ATPase subunit